MRRRKIMKTTEEISRGWKRQNRKEEVNMFNLYKYGTYELVFV